MNFEQAKTEYHRVIAECDVWSKKLQNFPTTAMGLTPDDVKKSPEYLEAQSMFASTFKSQKDFALFFVKTFKAELKAERAAKHKSFSVQNDKAE